MKKRNIFMLFVVAFIFLFKIDAHAATTCTKDEKQALKIEALNISYDYKLIHDENYQGIESEYYYIVSTVNYSKNLKLLVRDFYYDSKNINKDNEITIPVAYDMGKRETIEIYGADNGNCKGELILTKTITIPYYNKYSEREECKEYADYPICQPGTNTTSTTEESFLAQIEKIKNEGNVVEEPIEEEKGIFDTITDFVKENIVLVTVVVIVVITLIILVVIKTRKKKKNRIKIDI